MDGPRNERFALPGSSVTPTPETIRARVVDALATALRSAIASGVLPALDDASALFAAIEVSRPANPVHGDVASNLAMRLARPMRRAPLQIAEALAVALLEGPDAPGRDLIVAADAAPPGFLNLRLAPQALAEVVDWIATDPASWGRRPADPPTRHVNVEFVSANPTGPLHIGNARGAFVGDLLSRVLEAGGQRVTREYYFNDFGAQVRNLGASVLAIRAGTEIPEDGYHGDYVHEMVAELPAEVQAEADRATDPAWVVGLWASERVRTGIEASLASLGVRFDVWKSEGSLHTEGWIDRAVERLRAAGHLYEQDGALWFRSTTFGDDKDRVIVKSNGDRTYFAADIGYVVEKFSRGFDHLIYIWGADHHGTVARVRNAAEAMGYDRAHVEMILTGWVKFIRDGVEVSMSKRAGTFVTLDELLAEVGADAARWYFASRGSNVNIDFDIELAKKQSNENPVYYVQYAHARIASILRKATDVGMQPGTSVGDVIGGDAEGALARVVVRYPEVVEDAAAAQEIQGITTYATELATAFHAFYRDAKVVDAVDPVTSAGRLALVDATRITLANALGLLGISAPDSM